MCFLYVTENNEQQEFCEDGTVLSCDNSTGDLIETDSFQGLVKGLETLDIEADEGETSPCSLE